VSTVTPPGAGDPPPLVLRQLLDLGSSKVQVQDVQRDAIAGGGMRVRVSYRITAGERPFSQHLSSFIRIVAEDAARTASRTVLRHTGQSITFLSIEAEDARDLVSEFIIPDATDDLVLRFSDQRGIRTAFKL
jgi:hypothetical protein